MPTLLAYSENEPCNSVCRRAFSERSRWLAVFFVRLRRIFLAQAGCGCPRVEFLLAQACPSCRGGPAPAECPREATHRKNIFFIENEKLHYKITNRRGNLPMAVFLYILYIIILIRQIVRKVYSFPEIPVFFRAVVESHALQIIPCIAAGYVRFSGPSVFWNRTFFSFKEIFST